MWRFLKADEITKDDVGKAWESGSMSSSRCPVDAQAAQVPRCPKAIDPRGGDGFLHASCKHAPLANHALHPLVVSPVTSKPDYPPATFSRANGCFTSTRGSRHLEKGCQTCCNTRYNRRTLRTINYIVGSALRQQHGQAFD